MSHDLGIFMRKILEHAALSPPEVRDGCCGSSYVPSYILRRRVRRSRIPAISGSGSEVVATTFAVHDRIVASVIFASVTMQMYTPHLYYIIYFSDHILLFPRDSTPLHFHVLFVTLSQNEDVGEGGHQMHKLSLIHISEPTRQEAISYAVFCLK